MLRSFEEEHFLKYVPAGLEVGMTNSKKYHGQEKGTILLYSHSALMRDVDFTNYSHLATGYCVTLVFKTGFSGTRILVSILIYWSSDE